MRIESQEVLKCTKMFRSKLKAKFHHLHCRLKTAELGYSHRIWPVHTSVFLWKKPKCITPLLIPRFSNPDDLGQDVLSSSDKGILLQCNSIIFPPALRRKERASVLSVEMLASSLV